MKLSVFVKYTLLLLLVCWSWANPAEVFSRESFSGKQAERVGVRDPSNQNVETKKFHALLDHEWEWTLRNNPVFASELGDFRWNAQWPMVSPKDFRKRHAHRLNVLKELKRIETNKLSEADRVNFRLYERELKTAIEAFQYKWHLVPLTQREGIQTANNLTEPLPFEKVKDYEDWIARMKAFPRYMDQTIALLKEGIETRRVQTKIVMKRVPNQIRQQIVKAPEKSLWYKPLRNFSLNINKADRKRLRQQAQQAIRQHVVPSYKKMLKFFEREYLPRCFNRVGVWQVPNGKKFYEFRARKFTTANLTPKEIHIIGLKEVARIRKEMQDVYEEVQFKGTFKEFLADLRTNPKFFHKKRVDLLNDYKKICKKIDSRLPKLFSRLPKIGYDIKVIPASIAPDTTTAYYQPPAADGSRIGGYYVNLYKLSARPIYEIEALSLHEAQPGHHLQIALAMELGDLPKFRRFGGYTAFVEGWGLYSERLGEEIGLYQDPYSKMGQLSYQMWRAVRLVVDTGMHAFQWEREKAIDFFLENSPRTKLDVANEIDRYISWPGQALAYKIGELKILELRQLATKELGERFDVREFHDVVLSGGAVTLDILEDRVKAWIKSKDDAEPSM
ncbi:MAG: DUF885 family protein [Gemmataceae bacterium]